MNQTLMEPKVTDTGDRNAGKEPFSDADLDDEWKKRCAQAAQAPSTGAGDLQNTAMEQRDGAALGNPYLRSSCACQVGVGRVQLQRIAVETTVRHAA